jgi:cobalamin biosynthesis Mg chelatase CobN
MAEKVLENPVCETCGVDVRPQSMFCYNCGGAVSDTVVEDNNGKVSGAWLNDDFSNKSKSNKTSKTQKLKAETADNISESNEVKNEVETASVIEEPELETKDEVSESSDVEKIEEKPVVEKSGIQKDAKLKSAAAMRRKAKSFQAKQVEVVWEEPETSSSVKLVLVVLLLTLFAAAVVGVAGYLK